MGRGDRKTKKGKIFRGSSGNTRMKNKKPTTILSQPEVKKTAPKKAVEQEKKPAVKKVAPKKAAPKKTAEK